MKMFIRLFYLRTVNGFPLVVRFHHNPCPSRAGVPFTTKNEY